MDAISTGCKEFRGFIKISQTFIAFAYAKVGLPIISFKHFLEGKKILFPQKSYRWSKQPINEIIGSPTLADSKASLKNIKFILLPINLSSLTKNSKSLTSFCFDFQSNFKTIRWGFAKFVNFSCCSNCSLFCQTWSWRSIPFRKKAYIIEARHLNFFPSYDGTISQFVGWSYFYWGAKYWNSFKVVIL